MNTTDFIQLLQQPKELNSQQIGAVRSVIDEFPFFQSARAIYLKGLKNKGSFKYNQELKTTAAYTTDRSVLFDYITSDEFLQNEISQHIKQNFAHLKDIQTHDIQDISVNKSMIIDDALRQHIRDTKPILDPALFEAKEIESVSEILKVDTLEIEKSPEETLEIGKPLEFDKSEMHSFSEWLKITSFKPIIRQEDEVESESEDSEEPKSEKFKLVDQFIATNPKMPQISSEGSQKNIAKEQMIQTESLMTETLARIYLEQKNYEKAIQAYNILSLKYPEKSGFFADQIQAVKQLQKQNK